MRRDWKEFKGVAARRIPDQIRSSINQKGEITFDLATFEKMGEPLAMFLFYEEHTQTIGLKPAHPDAPNAVLVRARHTRTNRVVRSRPFLLENGIEIDRTLRFTFPFIEDGVRPQSENGRDLWNRVCEKSTKKAAQHPLGEGVDERAETRDK